jgi:hypothetical protein
MNVPRIMPKEAERLLRSWWLSTHVTAQVHATLALYYANRAERARLSESRH